jgi:hypothetical protein
MNQFVRWWPAGKKVSKEAEESPVLQAVIRVTTNKDMKDCLVANG